MDGTAPAYQIHEEVVRGSDNQLFISGGRHRVEDYLLGKLRVSEESLRTFATNLRRRRSVVEGVGAKYVHIVCPDKQTICNESYPLRPVVTLGHLYRNSCTEPFLFPEEELRNGETYHRTDSHWNWHGALVASRGILEQMDVQPSSFEQRLRAPIHAELLGDLGAKINAAPEEVTFYADVYEKLRYSNESPRNNGLVDIVVNLEAGDNRRLLVFGDSFLRRCVTYLSDCFRFTLFVRSPYFHNELFLSYQPTHVVTGSAERYLSRVEGDDAAENVFLWALLRGLEFDRNNKFYTVLSSLTTANRNELGLAVSRHAAALIKQGRPEKALGIIQNWLSYEPLTEPLAIQKSKAQMRNGEVATAVRSALQSVEEFGRSAKTLCQAGSCLLLAKRYHKALKLFEEASEKAEAGYVALRGKALALRHLGRYDEALSTIEMAASESDGSPDVMRIRTELLGLVAACKRIG